MKARQQGETQRSERPGATRAAESSVGALSVFAALGHFVRWTLAPLTWAWRKTATSESADHAARLGVRGAVKPAGHDFTAYQPRVLHQVAIADGVDQLATLDLWLLPTSRTVNRRVRVVDLALARALGTSAIPLKPVQLAAGKSLAEVADMTIQEMLQRFSKIIDGHTVDSAGDLSNTQVPAVTPAAAVALKARVDQAVDQARAAGDLPRPQQHVVRQGPGQFRAPSGERSVGMLSSYGVMPRQLGDETVQHFGAVLIDQDGKEQTVFGTDVQRALTTAGAKLHDIIEIVKTEPSRGRGKPALFVVNILQKGR